VQARGKIGALDCFARDDTVDIAATATVRRTLGLLRINNGICPQ
jgi:hypothetical protein